MSYLWLAWLWLPCCQESSPQKTDQHLMWLWCCLFSPSLFSSRSQGSMSPWKCWEKGPQFCWDLLYMALEGLGATKQSTYNKCDSSNFPGNLSVLSYMTKRLGNLRVCLGSETGHNTHFPSPSYSQILQEREHCHTTD